MRRFRRPAVTVSKRRVILFRLFLVFCAAFAVFSVLDNRLRPVITTMAQYQCRVVSVLAMNEAVMEELNEVQDIEQALVEVDKAPDGTVSAIEINSVEVNRLKTRLTISRRKAGKALDEFLRSFGDESESLEREFKSRLQEIEDEIAREREKKNQSEQEKEENYKY